MSSHLCQHVHDGVVRHKRDGRLGGDASQPRNGSLVEGAPTLVAIHLPRTVPAGAVPVAVETLHARLYHVDGRIGVRRYDAGKHAEHADEPCGRLGAVPLERRVLVATGLDDAQTHRLVAALFEDRGGESFVEARESCGVSGMCQHMLKANNI